jgi:DnaK suppressor protein
MTARLTAEERGTLARELEARRRVVRAELTAKLNAQENPALLGLRNRMEETDDWAVADLETALDVAEVSRDAGELSEIEAALARLADETYGTCVECAAPIPFARLHANPSAARCIPCQERLEAGTRRGPATL